MLLFHIFQYHVDLLNEVFRCYYIDLVVSSFVLFDCASSNFGIQSWSWNFQANEGVKCVKDSR